MVAIGNLYRGGRHGIHPRAHFTHHRAQPGSHARQRAGEHAQFILAVVMDVLRQVPSRYGFSQCHSAIKRTCDGPHQHCSEQHAQRHHRNGGSRPDERQVVI
ncbi:hypothetical protein D3C71_1719670 [compost metagenome]